VLLDNDGTLPLAAPKRIAVIGPTADDPLAVLGCYAFPRTWACTIPSAASGIELPTLRRGAARRVPDARSRSRSRHPIDGARPTASARGRARGIRRRRRARPRRPRRLFGRGTSGEGCDAESPTCRLRRRRCARPCSSPARRPCSRLLARPPLSRSAHAPNAPPASCRRSSRRGGARARRAVLLRAREPQRAAAGERAGQRPARSRRLPGVDARPQQRRRRTSTRPPRYPFGHGLGYTTLRVARPEVTRRGGTDGTAALSLTVRTPATVRDRDRAAVPARPGGLRRAAGAAADRVRACGNWRPGHPSASTSRCRPTSRRSPGATVAASSNPGSLVLASGGRAPTCRCRRRSSSPAPVRVVDHTRALHPAWSAQPMGAESP
jgi:beta-xylosidase